MQCQRYKTLYVVTEKYNEQYVPVFVVTQKSVRLVLVCVKHFPYLDLTSRDFSVEKNFVLRRNGARGDLKNRIIDIKFILSDEITIRTIKLSEIPPDQRILFGKFS